MTHHVPFDSYLKTGAATEFPGIVLRAELERASAYKVTNETPTDSSR